MKHDIATEEHEDLLRRVQEDLMDGYDEEFELEAEARQVDATAGKSPDPACREERRRHIKELFRLQGEEVMLERTHIEEAPCWVVQAVDKKRARLNCIHHLLSQIPYTEMQRPAIELPPRERHADYARRPVPDSMFVPDVF